MSYVPAIFATAVDQPTINSASIDGDDFLVANISRGGDSPDFSFFRIYWAEAPGIDITDPLSYDGTYETPTSPFTSDPSTHNSPTYLVVVEVAYDGVESEPTPEFEATSGGGGGSDGGPAGPDQLTPGTYWGSPHTGLSVGVY